MNRTEKAESVESLKEKFSKAQAAFLTEYRGMSVEKLYDLRKKVREGQGELKVVKNRLARIAAKGSPFEQIAAEFKGPIAIAFAYKDAVAVAKAVSDSVSDTSPLKVKSGSLDGKTIDSKGVVALSKLPSREVLLSMLLGTLKAPMQNFANVISAVPRDLANALTAVKDKKPQQ
jgi:large subunit ribosomal protein L10